MTLFAMLLLLGPSIAEIAICGLLLQTE